MLLFKYVEQLFEAQKEIIDAYQFDAEEVEEVEEGKEGGEGDEQASQADLPPSEAESRKQAKVVDPDLPLTFLEAQKQARDNAEVQTVASSVSRISPSKSEPQSRDWINNLADAAYPVKKSKTETPFFWHVPKAGGTTVQRLYWCMGSTIANEVGVNPKFGVDSSEHSDIIAFKPWDENPGKVINVDVCSPKGILEAKKRGFLDRSVKPRQATTSFVSTSEFHQVTSMLFAPDRQARMFALFRHPIDRAVSKFYYLQKATWEPTYNAKWAKMTLDEWASRDRGENNWMTRKLVGKSQKDELTPQDLDDAKEILRTKFVVGLMDKMEESVHRFNLVLGVDEGNPTNKACIEDFSKSKGDSNQAANENTIEEKNEWNSYAHPEAARGSEAWVNLAKIHMYDNLLYKYITELFAEQSKMFRPNNKKLSVPYSPEEGQRVASSHLNSKQSSISTVNIGNLKEG